MSRPPKPSFGAFRVVKASTVLTDKQKMVWMELYALDQGDEVGCFIGATGLAERLGRSVASVEKRRRELVALGLLATETKPGRRTASWYVVVPTPCVPASDKPAPGDITMLRDRLDAVLSGRVQKKEMAPDLVAGFHGKRQEVAPPTEPVTETPAVDTGTPADGLTGTPVVRVAFGNGTPAGAVLESNGTPVNTGKVPTGAAGGAPEESQTRISNLTEVRKNPPSSEVGAETEVGGIARDGGEDGATAASGALAAVGALWRSRGRGGNPVSLGSMLERPA